MEDEDCKLCDNTGVNPDNGKMCVCVIQKAINNYFRGSLTDIKVPDYMKSFQFDEDFMEKDIYFGGGIVPTEHNLSKYRNDPDNGHMARRLPIVPFVKYYILKRFLRNPGYTYFYGTGKDVFDVFMSDDMAEQKRIVDCDLFVVCIGNDFKNNYIQELLPFILGERATKGKQSFILWVNKSITESADRTHYIKEKYGQALFKIISTQVVVADKKVRFDGNKFISIQGKK